MGDSAVLTVNARVGDLGRAGLKLIAVSAVSQVGYWYTCGASHGQECTVAPYINLYIIQTSMSRPTASTAKSTDDFGRTQSLGALGVLFNPIYRHRPYIYSYN